MGVPDLAPGFDGCPGFGDLMGVPDLALPDLAPDLMNVPD